MTRKEEQGMYSAVHSRPAKANILRVRKQHSKQFLIFAKLFAVAANT